jgi:hypothetical protein
VLAAIRRSRRARRIAAQKGARVAGRVFEHVTTRYTADVESGTDIDLATAERGAIVRRRLIAKRVDRGRAVSVADGL